MSGDVNGMKTELNNMLRSVSVLRWVSSSVTTSLRIIMTGMNWRVLDSFAILFPNHIFPVVKIPANNYPEFQLIDVKIGKIDTGKMWWVLSEFAIFLTNQIFPSL